MANSGGRRLRGGRCDVCGRCCIWCGRRHEPRGDGSGRRNALRNNGVVGHAGPDGDGADSQWRGELRQSHPSRAPLHPFQSPARFDDLNHGDGSGSGLHGELRNDDAEMLDTHGRLGQLCRCRPSPAPILVPHSPARLDEIDDGDGARSWSRGRERCRRTWWSRCYQRLLTEGVDFASDTQKGPGDDFEVVSDSNDEACDGVLSSVPDDDEVVPETEVQELEAGKEAKQNCSPASGMSSDAETEDGSASKEIDVGGHFEADPAWEAVKNDLLGRLLPGHS